MRNSVNVFLRKYAGEGEQICSGEGLVYRQSTVAAMDEARRISRDESVPAYTTMEDLKRALEE